MEEIEECAVLGFGGECMSVESCRLDRKKKKEKGKERDDEDDDEESQA